MKPMSACGETTGLPSAAGTDRRKPGNLLFSYQRTLWLTLLLLIVVTVLAVLELSGVMQHIAREDRLITWTVCGLLISLAFAMLLLGRYMTQRTLEQVEMRLRDLASGATPLDQISTPVPDELRAVMRALDDYVALVCRRMDGLRRQQRNLDTRMRAVDAEKRHTETVINSICDPVLAIDSDGCLTLANSAAERTFGFRLAESDGRPVHEIIADAPLAAMLRDAASIGRQQHSRQAEYSIGPRGNARTFKITCSRVLDESGGLQGMVAAFHDVTREREVAQLKTDLVSAVSHELRTPLSSIRAYVEMLVDDEAHDDGQRREFYQIIEGETGRLQRLINNVLNISRIEAGALPVRRECVPINNVARDVVNTLAPQAEEKSLSLAFEAGEDLPSLQADRDLLQQAVMNVVGNSIKYTPRGGHVSVATALDREASHVTLTVTDDGIGIQPGDLPRIFDKFYRTRDSAGIAKGTGLGLNLVRHIVETVHRGKVSVASEHGQGTTMSLRFPVRLDSGASSHDGEAETRSDRRRRDAHSERAVDQASECRLRGDPGGGRVVRI